MAAQVLEWTQRHKSTN